MRERAPRTAATASAAGPPSMEKPNFESSCPVEMYECVDGFTPGVTRISTRWRVPRAAASRPSSAISSRLSTMIVPTPASSASPTSPWFSLRLP